MREAEDLQAACRALGRAMWTDRVPLAAFLVTVWLVVLLAVLFKSLP